MTTDHPSDLDLELLRTGEAGGEVQAHVDGCDACRDGLALLEGLSKRLASTVEPLAVPPELDETLIARARERGAAVRRELDERRRSAMRRAAIRRAFPLAAAACVAAVLAGVLATRGAREPARGTPGGRATGTALATAAPDAAVAPPSAAGPDDVNADGRVDVRDAYAIALVLERDASRVPRTWDRNADGRVDGQDVDRVAMAAVSLGMGGRP